MSLMESSINPTISDNVKTFVQESGNGEEYIFVKENGTTNIQSSDIGYDYYNFRNYGKELSDFEIGSEGSFVGGELHDIEDTIDSSTVYFKPFKNEKYIYNTFTNILNSNSNIGDTNTYIGGELHIENVNADVYKGEWNSNESNDDTDKIREIKELSDNVDIDENNITKEIKNLGYDYYNFRNYGKELSDFEIGSTGSFVGGELREIQDDEHEDINGIIINSTTIKFTPFKNEKYVYNTFNNALNETGNIGDTDTYIGGELHEEDVDADIYKGQWNSNESNDDIIDKIEETKKITEPVVNGQQFKDEANDVKEDIFVQETNNTKETHKPVYDDYNLRNGDALIGTNMVIGGSMTGDTEAQENNTFYIGGELIEIQDTLDNMIISTMGNNSNTELIVANPLVIGESKIGDTYIKARLVTWENRKEESYMNVGDFDIFSDEDNWSIGVYRKDANGNYILLEDHNQSAI